MKTFDFNIFQLLILLGSVQGLIFAVIIFIRKKFRIRSNVFLGLMVIFISLSNMQHLLIDLEYLSDQNLVRKLYPPLQWLIMPMFYLHVREVVFPKGTKSYAPFFLMAPVALIFFLHTLYFLYNSGKMPVAQMPDYYSPGPLLYSNFVSFIFNGVIIYLVYRMLQTAKGSSESGTGKKSKELTWYESIIKAFVIIPLIGLLTSFSIIIFKIDHTVILYLILLMVSFVGYFMGYMGVYRSTVLMKPENQYRPSNRHGLKTYKKVNEYILREQLYLDKNLSLSEIAGKFNISVGYLSQLVNSHSQQGFNDYINELRIQASKEMLIDQNFENYTIESIGLECGFKSKSNFYASFKKFTGQTPKGYKINSEISPVS